MLDRWGFLCSAGLAECLRDSVKVDTWNNLVKKYQRPGWLYSADRQCQFVFGAGYGLCPYMVRGLSCPVSLSSGLAMGCVPTW